VNIGFARDSEGEICTCYTIFLYSFEKDDEVKETDIGIYDIIPDLVKWVTEKLQMNERKWLATEWLESQYFAEKGAPVSMVLSVIGLEHGDSFGQGEIDSFGQFIEEYVGPEFDPEIWTSKNRAQPGECFGINVIDSTDEEEEERDAVEDLIERWWHVERWAPREHQIAADVLVRISEESWNSREIVIAEHGKPIGTASIITNEQDRIRDKLKSEFPKVHQSFIWTSCRSALGKTLRRGLKAKAGFILREHVNHNKRHGTASGFRMMDNDSFDRVLNDWKESVESCLPEDHKLSSLFSPTRPSRMSKSGGSRSKRRRKFGTYRTGARGRPNEEE
jgi:hypothetical protein